MKVRGLVCCLLGGALLACSSTPSVIPARNLERPTDMGMVCLAVDPTSGQLSGQPMSVCHPTDKADPPVFQPNSSVRSVGTFALVSNTARGELSAVDLDRGKLIDLDPVVFGFNMVQVGSMPENLAASPDGCWVATANRVSCDIGLVDSSRLLAPLFPGATPSTPSLTEAGEPIPVAQRITPQTGSGRKLQLAPKEIVFLLPDQAPGLCTGKPSSLALVSFPSCDLVALMDLSTGIIKDSVYLRSDGTVAAGAEPICFVDYCVDAENPVSGDDAGAVGGADTGAGDAGEAGVPSAPGSLGVGALALRPDRPTAYVGASHDDHFLAVLNVLDGKLVDGGRIALEAGALGINHLRLSVDPWQTPPKPESAEDETAQAIREMRGSFIGTRGEFLYAFAQDGSVRVVDVTSQPGRECDVNARPELAGPVTTPCFPVNPKTRQPLARGPGIRIPTLPVRNAAPPIPRDITVLDLRADTAQIEKNPQGLSGQFAFLLASDNSIYVLNLSPHDTGAPEDPVMTHSFREIRASGQSAPDMLMLVSTPPLRTTVTSDLLFATTPLLSSSTGPRLERVTTTTPPAVPISSNFLTSDYYADFPNQSREVSRNISIVWEDLIPNTARKSGKLLPPSPAAPAGTLEDKGADFCGKGVLKGDLVLLPGCTEDTDCSPQELYSCRQPVSGSSGLCLPLDASQGLREECSRFSGSRRRYEILDAKSDRLLLGLHLDEVPKTVLNRWNLADTQTPHTDAECQPAGADSTKANGARLGFSWQQVWPNETFKRCVEPCAYAVPDPNDPNKPLPNPDLDCRPGFVCEALPGSLPAQVQIGDKIQSAAGYCVEAPPLTSECWPQPGNAYQVNAGTSFWVSGSFLPDLPSTKVDAQGSCQADPNDSLLVNRIPMSAPECATLDGTAPISSIDPAQPLNVLHSNTELALFGPDAATSKTPKPPYSPVLAPGPNPCLYQDINRDEGPSATGESRVAIKAIFQNPEIRFVLTNLDQYGGDGLVTRLNLKGGFFPLPVDVPNFDVALTQPIRIFTGPTKLPDSPRVENPSDPNLPFYHYMYVLDQGRTALTPGSRGQIVRINARKGSDAQVTVDPASSGTQPFQIQ